jgi:hypothetical protein
MCATHSATNQLAAMRAVAFCEKRDRNVAPSFRARAGPRLNDGQMRGVASELVHNTVLRTLDASGAATITHTPPRPRTHRAHSGGLSVPRVRYHRQRRRVQRSVGRQLSKPAQQVKVMPTNAKPNSAERSA